ncbi:serine hydrolase domain-containing protein [Actinosynnema sp. NPDC050436]|uniref:serine hydrolase domain-containing protein n=1 Tax=Actinosynnema sp. NPDC050436 TaxID=3155659 RepID=UPI0033C594D5
MATTRLTDDLLVGQDWQARLDELRRRHRVPGCQVGLMTVDGDLRVLASGLAGVDTGVETTADTLFHYGSIGKLWTATLVLQLVDDGLLDLDTPVVEVLPGFTLATPEYAERITVRHLLVHTSGIDGDLFTDTGPGDDCLEKYVASLATAASVTEPGGPLSYCNSGFVVAGRVVEVLRGSTWDDALAERIYEPLGLTHVLTLPNDAPLFRTAIGHGLDDDVLRQVPHWQSPRSNGPAGSVSGTAGELLRFAVAHLRDGEGLNGGRVLSPGSARLMREKQVDLSRRLTTYDGWGLGWMLSDWNGARVVHHGGATDGQIAQLRTFPELGLALCALTNADHGAALVEAVEAELLPELGLAPGRPVVDPDAAGADVSSVLGRYESRLLSCELENRSGSLTLRVSVQGQAPGDPVPVTPLGGDRFEVEFRGTRHEFAHLVHDGREFLHLSRLLERTV